MRARLSSALASLRRPGSGRALVAAARRRGQALVNDASRSPMARRGQALVEFAFVLPVLLMLFYGTYSFWALFHRVEVQTDAAFIVAELVARSGDYDVAIRDAITLQLDDSVAVDAADTYLFIEATEPDGTITTIGTPPPDEPDPPTIPTDTGWDSVTSIADLPRNSRVEVRIWSNGELSIPFIAAWRQTPEGSAVMYVLEEN